MIDDDDDFVLEDDWIEELYCDGEPEPLQNYRKRLEKGIPVKSKPN